MIVDSSALVAILNRESDAELFSKALSAEPVCRMSAATYVEVSIVVDRRKDPIKSRLLDALIDQLSIEIIPLSNNQAILARSASRNFGKGSGHPAQLNFGDCFTYALAAELHEPILAKGNKFVLAGMRLATLA